MMSAIIITWMEMDLPQNWCSMIMETLKMNIKRLTERLVGDYDLVPILDSFIKEHPDFSYHGRKGILAMTGYNGVLGYRTDSAYKTGEEPSGRPENIPGRTSGF